MKTTHLIILFFAFFLSASAQTGPSYGLPKLKEVQGARTSVDGRWINYDGSLYHIMDTSFNKDSDEPILFVNSDPYIVGARITLNDEFVYYGRNNYQKFRTGWKPMVIRGGEIKRPTGAVLGFAVFIAIFITCFARSTAKRTAW